MQWDMIGKDYILNSDVNSIYTGLLVHSLYFRKVAKVLQAQVYRTLVCYYSHTNPSFLFFIGKLTIVACLDDVLSNMETYKPTKQGNNKIKFQKNKNRK